MKAKTPDNGETQKHGCDETLFREKAERIVNDRIRPALRLHDGDITVQDARDGEIWVAFAGACHGCPSAQITLEEVVGQIFGEELGSEFKAVHLVNNVDEDLLNFARHLLDKNKK